MASNREDPYFIVRDEVQKSVQHLQELHQAWTQLDSHRRAGRPFNAEQWRWTSEEIKSTIKTIEWDIQDLEETVRIVEANPQKFHLDATEVQRRKAFVAHSKQTIENIHRAVVAPTTIAATSTSTPTSAAATTTNTTTAGNAPISQNQRGREQLLRGAAPPPSSSSRESRGNDMIRGEQMVQERILQEQDQQLESVYTTVVNMKNIASTMNNELDVQTKLLEDLDGKTESAQTRLKAAAGRLGTIIKGEAGDKQTSRCIMLLSAIVILLLIMVIAL